MWISKQVMNLFYLYTSIIIIIIKFKIVTLLQKMIIHSRFVYSFFMYVIFILWWRCFIIFVSFIIIHISYCVRIFHAEWMKYEHDKRNLNGGIDITRHNIRKSVT